MEVEKVLERIGPIKAEIVIDKNFFYCGRMKESDLVCLSLLVSREHCVFTKLTDGLYVTDLGSSNGVFINGNQIRAKKQVLLRENDYIGIGCNEVRENNLDSTMFVFKIKNRVTVTNDEISNQKSARIARKELSKARLSNSIEIPAKVQRPCAQEAAFNNVIDDNDDIEIIECTSTSNLKSKCENPQPKSLGLKKEIIECSSTSNSIESHSKQSNQRKEAMECDSVSSSMHHKAKLTNIKKEILECSSTSKMPVEKIDQNIIKKEIVENIVDIIDITDIQEERSVPKITRIENIYPGTSKSCFQKAILENNQRGTTLSSKTKMSENVENKSPSSTSTSSNSNKENSDQSDCKKSSTEIIVKEEPVDENSFSQIDLIEINDDEDSIFPFSQLFSQSSIKQECEDDDNNLPHSSLFLNDDEDDDNVITILDSDDENYNGNDANEIIPMHRIKLEPGLEFENVDGGVDPLEPSEAINMCVDSSNVPSTNEIDPDDMGLESISEIDKILPLENNKSMSSSLSVSLPKESIISNDTCLINNTKKRGLEIIEPHFIKPKKKSTTVEKKSSKKSRSKDSETKDNKKKSSSEITKSSSREKSKTVKDSSKIQKHKKDKDGSPSSSYEQKKSHKEDSSSKSKSKSKNNTDSKHKSSSSKSSNKHKHSTDKNEKEQDKEKLSKDNSDSTQNTLSTSDSSNLVRPRCRTTIVKVKVSSKTRGDMLCDSMQNLRPKPRKETKQLNDKTEKAETSKSTTKPNNFSSFVIPRRQIPSSLTNAISAAKDNAIASTPEQSHTIETITKILTNATNNLNLISSECDNNERSSPVPPEELVTNSMNPQSSGPPKPSLTIPSLLNPNHKKVSFKENIAAVREFPVEDGNKLRNIKDGLSIRSTRKDFAVYKPTELKIEDFLARLFAWEPAWLQQQQKLKVLPPIVKKDEMQTLPKTFDSFEQYYKRMEVLLLLETWQQLIKEFECAGNRYNSSVALPCTIVRHSIRQMQTPNGLRYSMFVINTLVSKHQLRLQSHPVYGDMIILEYSIKTPTGPKMRRAFAYVVQVQQQNSLKFLRSNEQLCKYVQHPDALLTYTVQTRIIDEQTVEFDRVSVLRSILYLRSHLRLIQGLQFVPHSALRDAILKVDIDEFQLESVSDSQIYKYQLVTQEKLNMRQMEAVIKFTTASVKLEPKIGLLVGPPGTGKSKVIANLVTQILYGDGRYVNGRPLRILVCAPSNAAIDEIVLRLLDIRSAIKEHRFKMVRIGRIESMHEEVKKISVSELARREAQKTYAEQQQKVSENVEHKKHKLKSDIDALELLVAGNPHNRLYKKDLDEYKAKFRKLAHKNPEDEAAELNKLQHSAKLVLLQKANVIACTLSSCYTGHMENVFGGNSEKIATCIVDEATQCCEAETLIPLMLGVKNLILVGDPNQLPATVMSNDAKKLGLDRSLFTRAKEALEPQHVINDQSHRDPVITLNVQYRMVNAISHWPNKFFYGGKLIDFVNYKQSFPFQPYRVLNLDGLQDDIKFSNTSEAVFVGNLINCLMTVAKTSSWDKKITVGVITPYQNQKALIISTIKEQTKHLPENIRNKFSTEVNTIDSFQGQERDVIIMSCVRSSGIGFMSDQQRLCVALTRAKFTLIICGNFTTFQRDNTWKDLLQDARSRGVVARLNTCAKPSEIKPHVARLD